MIFKKLTDKEEKEHREWARENYKQTEPINGIWHPIVQHECAKMNNELVKDLSFLGDLEETETETEGG